MLLTKITSSLENCFLDSVIEDFDKLTILTALKNERISFQLLCALDDNDPAIRRLYKLSVEGALAEFVTVREVKSLPVAIPVVSVNDCDNYIRSAPGLYPDLLTPLRYNGRISVIKGNLLPLWVEIDLRDVENAPVGIDELIFTLSYNGEKVAEEKISIEIINASLPEQKLKLTQWFYTDCIANYYGCEVWSEEHWRIIESFAKTAKSNGINLLLTPVLTPALDTAVGGERLTTQLTKITVDDDGNYTFNFDLLDRWIDMCDRIGIKYLEIAHFFTQWGANHAPKVMATVGGEYKKIFGWETNATDPEYTKFLRSFISALLNHLKASGDDKRCFFHISDEPTKDHLESYSAAKNSIADLLEGYTIMDALSNYEFYTQGIVDTPIPCNDHISPFIEGKVDGLWTYYCSGQWKDVSNRFFAMPSYRNRSIGMQMYKYDIVGFLNWGYNFYNSQFSYDAINPYIDTCGDGWVPAGDTFSVYPGADGVALESFRIIVFYEAVQDIGAMRLAESLFGKEKVLEAIESAFGGEITFKTCARSAKQMLAVREAVNQLIKLHIED